MGTAYAVHPRHTQLWVGKEYSPEGGRGETREEPTGRPMTRRTARTRPNHGMGGDADEDSRRRELENKRIESDFPARQQEESRPTQRRSDFPARLREEPGPDRLKGGFSAREVQDHQDPEYWQCYMMGLRRQRGKCRRAHLSLPRDIGKSTTFAI